MNDIEDLRSQLRAEGVNDQAVMLADEPGYRADGTWIVHRRTDGGVVVATWERGKEWEPETFATEAEAIRVLAGYLLPSRKPPVRPLTPEERQARQARANRQSSNRPDEGPVP